MQSRRRLPIIGGVGATLVVAALTWGTSPARANAIDWDAVAQCESGGDWTISTGNGYSGGLQFSPATWAEHGGRGDPARASRSEQIRIAERELRTQGLGAWPVCGPRGADHTGAPRAPRLVGCEVLPANAFGLWDLRRLCQTLTTTIAPGGG